MKDDINVIEEKVYSDPHEIVKTINKYTKENNLSSIHYKEIKVDGGYKIKIIE